MVEPTQMNGHTGNNEIGTPQELFDWLNRRFKFNYDAAASDDNAKCDWYSTVTHTIAPVLWVDDRALLDMFDLDGLTYEWRGKRVFVNPPYGRGIFTQFIEKAMDERSNAEIIVMLAKYDASTRNGRLLRDHFHLEYLPRIKYEGMTQAAPFPSVIAIARQDYLAKETK